MEIVKLLRKCAAALEPFAKALSAECEAAADELEKAEPVIEYRGRRHNDPAEMWGYHTGDSVLDSGTKLYTHMVGAQGVSDE